MAETRVPMDQVTPGHIEFMKRLDKKPNLHNFTAEPTLYRAGLITYHNTQAVITHDGRRAIEEYDRTK